MRINKMSDFNLIEFMTDMTLMHINNDQTYKDYVTSLVHKSVLVLTSRSKLTRNKLIYRVGNEIEQWFTSLAYDVNDEVNEMSDRKRKASSGIDSLVLKTIGEHLTRSITNLDYRRIAIRMIDDYIEDTRYDLELFESITA